MAQLSEPLKATLFWDDDDPEIGKGSIHEVLEREWQNGTLDIGDIKTIQQAVRLPNVRVKVVMDESADGFSFEFIEPAAMPQKTMFDQKVRQASAFRPGSRALDAKGIIVCCMYDKIRHMKRTNFFFPEQMLERLKAAKLSSGIPVSEIIRRAVEAYLKSMGH